MPFPNVLMLLSYGSTNKNTMSVQCVLSCNTRGESAYFVQIFGNSEVSALLLEAELGVVPAAASLMMHICTAARTAGLRQVAHVSRQEAAAESLLSLYLSIGSTFKKTPSICITQKYIEPAPSPVPYLRGKSGVVRNIVHNFGGPTTALLFKSVQLTAATNHAKLC